MRYYLTALDFKYSLVAAGGHTAADLIAAARISRLTLTQRNYLQLLNLCHRIAGTALRNLHFELAFVSLLGGYLWRDLSGDLLFLLFLQDDVERAEMLLTWDKRLKPSVRVPKSTRTQDRVVFVTCDVSRKLWRFEEALRRDFTLRVLVRILARRNTKWIDKVLLLFLR